MYIYIYIYGIVSLRASVLSPFRSSWIRTLLGGLWNVHNSYETCTTSMERAQLLWNVRNSYETCATSMIYISSQTLQKALNDTIPTYVYVPKLSQIAIWWDKLASLTMKCWIATWENHGILSDAPIDPGQWQAIRCALRWIHGVRHLVEHFRSSYGFLKGFFMGFNQQNMGFNGISCGLMVFNGVSWVFMGFHGISWDFHHFNWGWKFTKYSHWRGLHTLRNRGNRLGPPESTGWIHHDVPYKAIFCWDIPLHRPET